MPTTPNPSDGKAILLSMVNSLENLGVTVDSVDFGFPVKASGTLPIRNTSIKITPKANSGFYGVKTLWYDRIHTDQLGTITVNKGTATRYVHLLPAINSKYGLFLTADDIIDAPLPVLQTGEIVVNLPFNPNSLMFYFGPVIVSQGFTPGNGNVALTPALWDNNVKSSLITIDNTGYLVSSLAGHSMVRSSMSFTSGKRYMEFTVPGVNGIIGFGTPSATTDILIGSDQFSWSIDTYSGLVKNNGLTVVDLSTHLAIMQDRPIGLMLDLDAKTASVILQGNLRVDLTGVTIPNEPIFVMAGNKTTTVGATVTGLLGNFGQTTFAYTVPIGYFAGFGSGGAPTQLTSGTLISQGCVGMNMVGTYSNGTGGTYTAVIETNSVACGYIAPPPSTTVTLSVDAVLETINESATATATAVFTVTPAAVAAVNLVGAVNYTSAAAADHGAVEFKIGTGAWTALPVGGAIVLPIGQTQISMRTAMVADLATEGVESFSFSLDEAVGGTSVTNTSPVVKTFTITDSSVSPVTIPQVLETRALTGSSSIVIPAGALEAVINGTGETGVSAVTETIAANTDLHWVITNLDNTTDTWTSADFGLAKIVRCSNTGKIQYSTDGLAWTNCTIPGTHTTTPKTSVIFLNNFFFVLSSNAKPLVSTDGISFVEMILPGASQNFSNFKYLGGKFFAIGKENETTHYSTNGTTWIATTGLDSLYGWHNIVFGAGIYVAHWDSAYAVSSDGITWTTYDVFTELGGAFGSFNSMAFGAGVFVATLTAQAQIATSTDGIAWTKSSSSLTSTGFTSDRKRVIFANNKFVIMTTDGSPAKAATSDDGYSWTAFTLPQAEYYARFQYVNNLFIAAHASNQTCIYSIDGESWTSCNFFASISKSNFLYAFSKYFAFGSTQYAVGQSRLAGAVVTHVPAVIGNDASAVVLGVTYSYPGTDDSTPAVPDTDTITLNPANSTTVTYVAPTGTTVELNWYRDEATALLSAPGTATLVEGGNTTVTYTLANALERAVTFDVTINHTSSTVEDLFYTEYRIGTGPWGLLTFPGVITVPLGQTTFSIKMIAVPDTVVETTEAFNLVVQKAGGTVVVLNSAAITTTVSITNVAGGTPIVAPTFIDFYKAGTKLNRTPTDKRVQEFTGTCAAYSRNSVSSGKYYFEVSDFDMGAGDGLFAGVALPGVFVNSSALSPGYENAWVVSLSEKLLRSAGNDVTLTGPTVDASTVYGFAFDADAKTLQIFMNGTSVHTETLVYPNASEVFILTGNYTSGAGPHSLKLNTGHTAFAHTVPTGFRAGFGNDVPYFDDFFNNNKGIEDGAPINYVYDIEQGIGANLIGTYSDTDNGFNISDASGGSMSNIDPKVINYYSAIRYGFDITYQDGVMNGPGDYEERQFNLIMYSADTAKYPLAVAIAYRQTDGTSTLTGGNADLVPPRQNLDYSRSSLPATVVTLPFSGRHLYEMEVVPAQTGKSITIYVDGTQVHTFIDTGYNADEPVAIQPAVGWFGSFKLHSIKIENLNKDVFATTPKAITNPAVWTNVDSAVTLSNSDRTVSYSAFANSNSITSPLYNENQFGKWYWELTLTTVSADCAINVGVVPQTFLLTDTLYQHPTVGRFLFSDVTQGDVISVLFDADNGVLTLKKNNVQFTVINNIQVTDLWSAAVGDDNTTGTVTIAANFGQSAFVYTPPAGYNLGLGEQ